MMLSFFKVREDAIAPSRTNPSDAGADVSYCPDLSQSEGGIKTSTPELIYIDFDNKNVTLMPGASCLIPTGLKFGLGHGYTLMVCNRSGNAFKRNLVVGSHIIDPGYSGEVFVNLHNVGNKEQVVQPYERIAQLLMVPVVHFVPMQADQEESLYGMVPMVISNRGASGFGASGN